MFPCSGSNIALFGGPSWETDVRLCKRNVNIRHVLETGEASVLVNRNLVPISKWNLGSTTKFPSDYFQFVQNNVLKASFLTIEPSVEDQSMRIDNRCVVLPIKKYEVVQTTGRVKRVNGKKRDCLALTARTFDLIFEARWDTGDDLDLSLETPFGVVDFKNPSLGCFSLIGDSNIDSCYKPKYGRETIVLRRNCVPPNGRYTIVLKHTSNCDRGNTEWALRVTRSGEVDVESTGVSNRDGGAVIGREVVTWP